MASNFLELIIAIPEERLIKKGCSSVRKNIQIIIEIMLDNDKLKKEEISVEDIYRDIAVKDDETVDGFIITRNGRLGDITKSFYLKDMVWERKIKEYEDD